MIKRLLKKLLPQGIRSALGSLYSEIRIFLKHRKGIKHARKFQSASELKLHVGCGGKIKMGWVNIDLKDKADLTLDLREPLPFRNESCSMIYTEHFLEHIEYPEPVFALLKECNRVLKPAGRFIVSVPDLEWLLRSYIQKNAEYNYIAAKKRFPEWCETGADQINYFFRQNNEHRFYYDFETLKKLLERSSFIKVRRRCFDPKLDDKEAEIGSLLMDCIKPPTASGHSGTIGFDPELTGRENIDLKGAILGMEEAEVEH